MKFDCGETRQEKITRLGNWHDFFTLLPRKVGDHDCRWMETIQRRKIWIGGRRRSWNYEYRAATYPITYVDCIQRIVL